MDVIQDPKDESIFLPAAEVRKHLSDFRRDNPFSNCLPGGPFNMVFPGMHRIIQSPTVVALLYEFGSLHRQVFLDGRQLPKDPNPTWLGYSVGRWDGDTLVVETAGFEDPQTLTKPLTLSLTLDYAPDTEMLENICENERDSAREVGKANTTVELSSATLGRYVGTYEFRGGVAGVAGFMGRTQTVALIDGTLYLNALPLIPLSETRFDSTGAAAEFTIDTNGAHLILSQTEGDATYDRKP